MENQEKPLNTQKDTTNVEPNQAQQQEATKFCKHCGKKIAEKAVICPLCGCQVEEFNNNTNTNTNTAVATATATAVASGVGNGRPKNKWIALILCAALGWLGAHKFYEGKAGLGVLYIFTCGIFGIGIIIDFITLLFKPNPYYV